MSRRSFKLIKIDTNINNESPVHLTKGFHKDLKQ